MADLPRLFFIPAMYLSLFSLSINTAINTSWRYLALLLAVWATSGIGYAASIFFSPKNAQLVGAHQSCTLSPLCKKPYRTNQVR